MGKRERGGSEKEEGECASGVAERVSIPEVGFVCQKEDHGCIEELLGERETE